MNAVLCIRCWSTNMKRAMPVHKKIGTPGEAVIRKSNSVYDGGRSSSGCLSLHCEEREGFVH